MDLLPHQSSIFIKDEAVASDGALVLD